MIITINALKERIRRKEFYIIIIIGTILLLLLGSGNASMSINGVAITDFSNVFIILHITVNAVTCLLAMIISLKTIPNEYSRKTSHLIWVRDISQVRYHAELVFANFLSSVIAGLILYVALGIYIIVNGRVDSLVKLFPAFLILCVNIVFVSVLTSVLSIKLPTSLLGLIMTIIIFLGLFHNALGIYANLAAGISGKLVSILLTIIPNLNGVQNQAANMIACKSIESHEVLKMLLASYIASVGLIVFRKEEA